MRPIKFRGRFDNTGILIHGDLKHAGDEIFISGYQVDPESVVQLVGFDCDGNEVYEGDVFVVPCGTEIAARFIDNLTPNAKLKEDEQ